MEKVIIEQPEFEAVTDGEKESIALHPEFMLDLYKKRLAGVSTLTQTDEIVRVVKGLQHRIALTKIHEYP